MPDHDPTLTGITLVPPEVTQANFRNTVQLLFRANPDCRCRWEYSGDGRRRTCSVCKDTQFFVDPYGDQPGEWW